jgi:hypothetical protein
VGVSVGFSVGPVRFSTRLGAGRRWSSGSGSGPGVLDGVGTIACVALVGVAVWLAGAAVWLAVILVLCMSDLSFAAGRGLWWLGSESHRDSPSVVLRWSGVRWLWRQRVSRWVCWWRVVVERARAQARGRSEAEVYWHAREVLGSVGAWSVCGGLLVGGVLWFGQWASQSENPAWETPEWFWWAWQVCAVAVVLGVVVLVWRGFLWKPLAAAEAEAEARGQVSADAPASASADRKGGASVEESGASRADLRLGRRRRRHVLEGA